MVSFEGLYLMILQVTKYRIFFRFPEGEINIPKSIQNIEESVFPCNWIPFEERNCNHLKFLNDDYRQESVCSNTPLSAENKTNRLFNNNFTRKTMLRRIDL